MIKILPRINTSKYFLLKSLKDKKDEINKARRITRYQNYLIDQYILYDEYPSDETIGDNLTSLNTPIVQKDYQVPRQNTAAIYLLLFASKRNQLQRNVESQKEIIKNNLEYTKEIKNTHTIDKDEYKKATNHFADTTTRKILMEQAIAQGINPDIITHGLTYQNLEIAAANQMRESKMISDYEKATAVNNISEIDYNTDPIITGKKWIWSELDNTRHSNMDGETVGIDDYFTVLNEVTGDVDEMLHPHDPNGSPGNVINCGCDVEYLLADNLTNKQYDILNTFYNTNKKLI